MEEAPVAATSRRALACVVDVDDVLVRDLVEEAEEGHLVRAEAPLAGADVIHGDGGGGQRRQHQPLPEISAAREPPGLLPTHPRLPPAPETVGCSLASPGLVRAPGAGRAYYFCFRTRGGLTRVGFFF